MRVGQHMNAAKRMSLGSGRVSEGVLALRPEMVSRKALLMVGVVALLIAAFIALMPAKAYAGTVTPLSVGSSTGKVWCQSSEDGRFSYYFYLSERSNITITVSHEVYNNSDTFCRAGLADDDYHYEFYPAEKKNTKNDSERYYIVYIPNYMSTSSITYSNLSAGGPYYFNMSTAYSGEGYSLNSYFSVSITDIISLDSAQVTMNSAKTHTGKAIYANPTVSLYDRVLTKDVDYKVISYSNNIKPGKAYVTVQGIGKYTGSKTGSFVIKPGKVSIKKPVAGNNKITVKWNGKTGASGYQVRYLGTYQTYDYSQGKYVTKWNSNWEEPQNAPSKARSKVLRLNDKAKYKVQVRAFKTVDGKRYYGAWSKSMTVKTK